jgi:hypothetical protein
MRDTSGGEVCSPDQRVQSLPDTLASEEYEGGVVLSLPFIRERNNLEVRVRDGKSRFCHFLSQPARFSRSRALAW